MKDLNLIPEHYLDEQVKKERHMLQVVCSVVAVLFLAIVVIVPLVQMYILGVQKGELESKAKEMEKIDSKAQEIRAIKEGINLKGEIERSLLKKDRYYLDLLEMLEGKTPKRVTLTSIMVSDDKSEVVIQGVAKDDIAAADYMNSLRKSGSFTEIAIDGLSANTSEEDSGEPPRSFTLSLKYVQKE